MKITIDRDVQEIKRTGLPAIATSMGNAELFHELKDGSRLTYWYVLMIDGKPHNFDVRSLVSEITGMSPPDWRQWGHPCDRNCMMRRYRYIAKLLLALDSAIDNGPQMGLKTYFQMSVLERQRRMRDKEQQLQ